MAKQRKKGGPNKVTRKEMEQRIENAKKAWKKGRKEANEGVGSYSNPEDGTYIMRLTGMGPGLSRDKNLQLTSDWTVVQGESKGLSARRWDTLERPEGLPYTVGYLRTLGVEEPDNLDLDVLETMAEELVAAEVTARVRLTTPKDVDIQRVQVLKLVELDEDESDESDDSSDDDDDDSDEDDDADEDDSDDDEDDSDDDDIDKDADEDEEESRPPVRGDHVLVRYRKKEHEGVVTSVAKKKGTCKVRLDKLKSKPVKEYDWGDAEILLDEDDE